MNVVEEAKDEGESREQTLQGANFDRVSDFFPFYLIMVLS